MKLTIRLRRVWARSGSGGMGLLAAASLLLGAGCEAPCGDDQCIFSEEEWKVVQSLSPLPDPPLDPTNRFDGDPAAVELGQMLFFEKRYSKALKVASYLGAVGDAKKVGCVTCHDPDGGFADTKSSPRNMSVGVSWTTRNTPSLTNTVYYGNAHGWDLRQDSLWCQASTTAETGTNSAGDRCDYVHMLWNFYRDRYDSLFADTPLPEELDPAHPNAARFPAACKPNPTTPGVWEMMPAADRTAVNRIMSNQAKAIAAYEAKLISRNAPFDRYVAGEVNAISETAKQGLKLFVGKASCVDCHKGPFFSDLAAHNLALPQEGPNVPAQDLGFWSGISQLKSNTFKSDGAYSDNVDVGTARNAWLREPTEEDKGAFRTATLRNISETAPYMHTGAMDSLRAVVEYYNKGGSDSGVVGIKDAKLKPLLLTEREIDELVTFLGTLTGEEIPAELRANPHLTAAP